MTTARARGATATAVPPRDLAAALRGAGLSEVDDSARRRAEYSTDASNYRVVPSVVVFPRHVEEAAAALDVARRIGVPVTSRGGGTSTAGNSVGSGIVLDFSRHLNRVLAVDPEARTAVVEPGAILDDITAAAARHGLRFGPDPSTHARASIGGSIGNNACGSRALRYGRTADNVVSLDVLTASGERLAARRMGRDGLAAGRAGRRRARRTGRGAPRHDPHRVRPVHPAGVRLLAGAPAAGERRGPREVPGRHRGHPRHDRRRDRGLVPSPKAVALAVLGYPGMPEAADAVPGLLPHRPVAVEGMDARLVDVFRARRGAAAVPALPRGESWLFVETAGDTEAEARAAAERLIADAGCLDALVVTGAPARALWRIREDGAGLGGRTPAGAPAWPGWEDAAVPPEHLGAYLRDFAALMAEHSLDGADLRALRRRLRARPHRLPVLHRAGPLPAVRRRRGATGGQVRRLDVRRARRRPGPRRAAARHVLTRGHRHDGRGQGDLRPGQRVQPRRAGRPGAAGRGPARAAGPAAAHAGSASPIRTTAATCPPRSTAASASASAGPTPPQRRRDVPVLPGHPGREGLHPRPVARAAGARERHAGQGLRRGGGGRGAGPVPVLQGLLVGLPGRGGHGHLQGRGAVPALPAPAAPAGPLLAGLAAPLGPAGLARAGAGERRAAQPGAGRPGQAAGGIDARRPLPRFAAQTFRAWFAGRGRRRGRDAGAAVGGHVHRLLHARGRPGRRAGARGGRVRGGDHRPARVLRADLDLHRPAGRCPPAAAAQPATPWTPALQAGTPIVGLEPSCTAVLRGDITELLPADPRARQVRAATRTLAELLAETPSGRRPTSAACARWPSRTATTMP